MQPEVSEGESVGLGEENSINIETVSVLSELLCSEQPIEEDMEEVSSSVKSYFDPALLHHPNVLQKLKILEESNRKPRDYFKNNQGDGILPYMRKVVAMWMLEVCEEQSCEDNVFPLAVGILDQFLGSTKIKAEQLQLIACVSLLLASKTRQETHFSLQLLSWYTENSVSLQTLMNWELMILSQLNWDINIVTPTDFVDFYLARTHLNFSSNLQLIRRHAITFISLCCTEPRFVQVSPSLIASSAIYKALRGVSGENSDVASRLASMGSVGVGELENMCELISGVISKEMSGIQQTLDKPIKTNTTIPNNQQPKYFTNSHSLTPTDVQDVLC